MEQSRISRRGVLGLTGGLAIAGVAGVAGAGLLGGGRVTAGSAGARVTAAPVKRFAHPGLLHTSADLRRMRTKVRAGAAPWKAGWKVLADNRHSQSGWKPRPQAT